MTRHICAICVLYLCNLCLPLPAQSIRYEGLVVNHGAAAAPSDSGISASLQLTIIRDSTAPLGAEVVIGPPLQGSGPASLWVWADSLVMFSISPTADSITWVAACTGPDYAGSYHVSGGPYAGQGGRWSIRPIGRPFPSAAAPDVRIRDWLTHAVARLETNIPAPTVTLVEADAQPVEVDRGPCAPPPEGRSSGGTAVLIGLGVLLVAGAGAMVWRYKQTGERENGRTGNGTTAFLRHSPHPIAPSAPPSVS